MYSHVFISGGPHSDLTSIYYVKLMIMAKLLKIYHLYNRHRNKKENSFFCDYETLESTVWNNLQEYRMTVLTTAITSSAYRVYTCGFCAKNTV